MLSAYIIFCIVEKEVEKPKELNKEPAEPEPMEMEVEEAKEEPPKEKKEVCGKCADSLHGSIQEKTRYLSRN